MIWQSAIVPEALTCLSTMTTRWSAVSARARVGTTGSGSPQQPDCDEARSRFAPIAAHHRAAPLQRLHPEPRSANAAGSWSIFSDDWQILVGAQTTGAPGVVAVMGDYEPFTQTGNFGFRCAR
jgi:hypothetical protein